MIIRQKPPGAPIGGGGPPAKEAWSLDRFAKLYDAIAVRDSGYAFDASPERAKAAEKAYRSGRHTSLQAFAESWFESEQRT